MKIKTAEFITSAVGSGQYPVSDSGPLPEIALIGKSNVGKSSLINRLVNRKSLAKTSSAPGKTRTINFYLINKDFHLVDLPGHGYAKVPAAEKKTWKKFVDGYFASSPPLRAVLILLDPRRDITAIERSIYEWVGRDVGVPVITVFTKCDKLSKNKLNSRIARLRRDLGLDDVCLFSSVTGEGKAELLKKIGAAIGSE